MPIDHQAIEAVIDSLQAQLDRLRGLLKPQEMDLDPKDPRNKLPDGKLSTRGVEICYRLFDEGETRYAVKEAMSISFGAATHRLQAWKKAGGFKRQKMQI